MAGADLALPGAVRLGRELATRVLVGGGLAVVALACVAAGGATFAALIVLACVLALREWLAMRAVASRWRLTTGVIYVALPGIALIWLRAQPSGLWSVLGLFVLVWSADIGAYVFGKAIGGPKLWRAVSPGKTWAGLAGAIIGACLGIETMARVLEFTPNIGGIEGEARSMLVVVHLGWVIMLSLLAVAGDLFESWLKRRAGVKDSGNLLPGHGGVLDRLDSLVPVAPAVAGAVWLGWL